MPASTILLLENDSDAQAQILASLTSAGYSVTSVADPDEALRRAAEHQLLLIDVVTGARSPVDVCREVRAAPALAAIAVLCISQTDEVEERIHFLEAGADDVVAKPFDARELEARIEALLLRFQRSRSLTPITATDEGLTLPARRRVVAVFSPKGGSGTTTIATNVAAASARWRPDRTVLVDLDLQFGQVATHLNLQVRQTLADAVRDEAALREPELLRTYATRHESGLHVLAAPASPELAETVTADHVERIVGGLSDVYESVVVDAGSYLDERVLSVFERAESVIFPVNPEIAALKALHTLLEYLNETGSVATKATFVLNNLFAKDILKIRDVESALGAKVSVELPYDPFIYLKAVNEGIPVVTGADRSAAAERLGRLAAVVFGEDGTIGVPESDERKPGRLRGLLRRP